jgi:hypothetical protein
MKMLEVAKTTPKLIDLVHDRETGVTTKKTSVIMEAA